MSWRFGWKPYVPVAQRRAKAAREAAKMAKKGRALSPVNIEGKQIARTFWGKAWCDNLESYSDYANRLPRGRAYLRNGSVVDLQVSEGKVSALVSGSSLYKIEISIKPLPKKSWEKVQGECSGKIDSLIELLQGRLSESVMRVVTNRQTGLFPSPSEITLGCSCPDWAEMCKHVASALYGVGARLDEKPELLFLLRGVNPSELITKAAAQATTQPVPPQGKGTIAETDLGEVFGIEMETMPAAAQAPPPARPPRKRTGATPAPRAKRKLAKATQTPSAKTPEKRRKKVRPTDRFKKRPTAA